MKLTKFTLIALAAGSLLMLGTALYAQDSTNTPPAGGPPAGGPPPGGGMRVRVRGSSIEQLTTNLSLTADQIPKVKAVLDDQRQKMGELFQNQDLSQDDRRAKMKEIRDGVVAKMKDILTPDQFEKWQKMSQRMRRPGGPGGPPQTGGNPPPPAGNPPGAPPQN
jgi:Spy/CpxP family protein refolding chaperone